jgi:hypothetical protein
MAGAAGATGGAGAIGGAAGVGGAGVAGTTGAGGAAGAAGTTGGTAGAGAGGAAGAGAGGTAGAGAGGAAGAAGSGGAAGGGGTAGATGAAGTGGTAGAGGGAGSGGGTAGAAGATGGAGGAGGSGGSAAGGTGGAGGGAGAGGQGGAAGSAGASGGGGTAGGGGGGGSAGGGGGAGASGSGGAGGSAGAGGTGGAGGTAGAGGQPFFIENFEDGDAIGWNPVSGTLGGSAVVNTTAAAGTTYSFRESAAQLYRNLPSAAQPTAISFWARAADTQAASIQFGGIAAISFGAQVNFGPGYITLGGQKSLFSVQYQVDTWIHVELRNVDWQAQTFDVYIDDALASANVPAALSPTSAIYLSATGAFTWDEIAIYQTTCTPNRPLCTGDVARVCNADGSGYTAASTTCNANACYIGQCVSSFLTEDFEDGDTAGWIPNPGTWTANVVTSTAAAGTAHSLELKGGTFFQGPYYRFNGVKPTHIGFWMMGVGAEFVVSTGTTADYNLVRIVGYDLYLLDGGAYGVPAADLAWHHVELRNIDWTARTFDIYVDGALAASKAFPSGVGTSVGRIDLFNVSTSSSTSHWDEIDVSP